MVISNHNSFRVLFDKIASVFEKKHSNFSTGNRQPREPALCQLYRHTFIPYGNRRTNGRTDGRTQPIAFLSALTWSQTTRDQPEVRVIFTQRCKGRTSISCRWLTRASLMNTVINYSGLLYTYGDMTSQNLWSWYVRHFVGITWKNVWS